MAVLLFSSCTTTRTAVINASDMIEVYTTKLPDRSYKEMNYIETSGGIFHTPQHLMNGLTRAATAQGADAVINVHYDFQGWWPLVSGTTIRYLDE
jgi:uncharacterized protein YbjQ (UPF0145 family)